MNLEMIDFYVNENPTSFEWAELHKIPLSSRKCVLVKSNLG